MTAAQIQALANLDDIIILPPVQIKRIGPTLKADNPDVMLLVYENGMYWGENDPTNLPESWYLHTAAGKRIVSNVGQGKLMNPQSTAPYTDANGTYNGWSDYIGQSCARQQTTYTAGCFLDLLGPAGIRPEYNVGGVVPVDPQTHTLFTPLDYESMTGSVADAARAALPAGATVTGNGYVNGHAYYLKASSTLNNYTDAAEAQAWLNRPAIQITASQWLRGVQMVIDNGAAGSGMLLEASCSCTNSTEVNASRTFDLATYLIANTGSAYFDFLAGSGGNLRAWQGRLEPVSPEPRHPDADLCVGRPVPGQRGVPAGLYGRHGAGEPGDGGPHGHAAPGVSHAGGGVGDLGQGRGPQRLDPGLLAPRGAWRPAHRSPRIATGPPATLSSRTAVAVAQLVVAPGCGPGGRGFESHRSPLTAPAGFSRSRHPSSRRGSTCGPSRCRPRFRSRSRPCRCPGRPSPRGARH